MATSIYLDDARKQEVRTGQGYLTIADSSQTLINPVTIRKETPQRKLLEEIQALQGWSSGSSGSASPEVPVSVPGPVSPEENEFPQESFVRWTTYQYANCCQLVSNRRYHKIPASGSGTSGTNYDQNGGASRSEIRVVWIQSRGETAWHQGGDPWKRSLSFVCTTRSDARFKLKSVYPKIRTCRTRIIGFSKGRMSHVSRCVSWPSKFVPQISGHRNCAAIALPARMIE